MAKKLTAAKEPATVLVLRCCAPDMSSANGFVWPGVGGVAIAPDWRDDANCGHGLHGWLYGQGDHGCSDYHGRKGARWLVVEVEESTVVMLGGKCKFPRGLVCFVGEKHEAAAYLIANEPRAAGVAVIGANLVCGDEQSVTVGALGTATAGHSGTATAGDSGTATAGHSGTATAGDRGTATAGHSGTATAGDSGTATAGDSGTATAGHSGTATAGDSGTATAGHSGVIGVRYWDEKNSRYRTVIGHVGENGIRANVAYRLNDKNELVAALPA